jgi:hypothetical protein
MRPAARGGGRNRWAKNLTSAIVIVQQLRGKPSMIWAWSYESSAVGDAQTHLLDIMRVAERRNAAAGLTGILAYDRVGYYQILEGTLPALAHMRLSILRDRRHRVNWARLKPLGARRTPASLPMIFLPCDIPHGPIMRPKNGPVLAAFEARLRELAAETFPTSYATVMGREATALPAPGP